MYLIATILILITSILLILIVLVQESKGGGLSANFTSSNQVMGVRKTTDFLEKATWTLAIALLVLSLVASMSIPSPGEGQQESAVKDQVEQNVNRTSVPNYPSEGQQGQGGNQPAQQQGQPSQQGQPQQQGQPSQQGEPQNQPLQEQPSE